jgi:PAS domain S-box-containing protein
MVHEKNPENQREDEVAKMRQRIAELEASAASLVQAQTLVGIKEEIYHILIEASPDPIIMYDLNGKILSANAQTARTYGAASVDEFTREVKNVFDLLTDEGRVFAAANFQRTLAAGISQKNEYLIRLRNGKRIEVEINSSAVRTATGDPWAFISVIRDVSDRKQAERSLREVQQRLDAHLSNSPAAIVEFDPSFKIIRWSGTAEKMFGWTAGEIIGKSIGDLRWVHEDDQNLVRQVSEGMSSGRHPRDLNVNRNYRKDGSIILCEWYNSAIYDEHRRLGSIFSIILDITERKRQEEELRASESKFRSIFEKSPIGIELYDREGRLLDTNGVCLEIFGVSDLSAIQGFRLFEDPNLTDDLKTRLKRGENVRYEMLFDFEKVRTLKLYETTQSGTICLDLLITPLLDDINAAPSGYLAHIRDISARRRAEDALHLNRERLEEAERIAKIGNWEANPVTGELYCSAVIFDIFGLDSESFKPNIHAFHNAIHPADRELVLESERQAEKTGTLDVTHRIIRPDGGVRFVHELAKRYTDNRGNIILRGTVQDVTLDKLMEAEKEKLEAQNRQFQKAESLGRMAGAIAHHFNNQLSVVIGNVEMAIDSLPQGADHAGFLNAAMLAANKAAEMSGLMLAYLGQSSGKQELFDLSHACLHSLPLIRTLIPRNIEIETDLPTPGPVVRINANQMQHVVTNLITNGWEAIGEKGGTVRLSVKTASAADIPPLYRYPLNWQPHPGSYACIEVFDPGCGIAVEDIEKIFDPFFSTKFTGRGLGLAIVLGSVKAHGGVITVESDPGRGSCFRIFLPIAAEGTPRQLDEPFKIAGIYKDVTLLLIEDDQTVRDMAAAMVKRLGLSVIEAKDGVEALEVFERRQEEIHCVLCDLTMPHLSGWETLAALRKRRPDIPVILASGYDEAHVMAGDHPELPQAFLSKPFNLQGLSDAIQKALGQRLEAK